MRISDWSSDVCSSDLAGTPREIHFLCRVRALPSDQDAEAAIRARRRLRAAGLWPWGQGIVGHRPRQPRAGAGDPHAGLAARREHQRRRLPLSSGEWAGRARFRDLAQLSQPRSEEHTSELQSLMRISYAVFCWKKKKKSIRPQRTRTLTNTFT